MTRPGAFRAAADRYEARIDWAARLERELPFLCEQLGPPGSHGVLDAGCGPGHHVAALIERGYRAEGADISEEMIELAGRLAAERGITARWHTAGFDALPAVCPGPYDGLICLGNALAATGSAEAVQAALGGLAAVLAPGGAAIIQVLNFPPMRDESPCVRGPRSFVRDGVEYVFVKVFQFDRDRAYVTGVTLWRDDGWQKDVSCGQLCAMAPDELCGWLAEAGLTVRSLYGAYDASPFDPRRSQDVIVVAERPAG